MKKRILLIITILIIVILVSIGVIYFISHKNSNFSKVEHKSSISSIPENILDNTETINNETNNIVSNEAENNIVADNTVVEENSSTPEEKKVEQATTEVTQTTTSTKSSNPSNNNTKTKETVKESKSTSTTTQTQKQTQSTPSQNSQQIKEEAKTEPKVERCTNNNNHSMNIGNSGKWFTSKNEAIAFYNEKISYWGEQWENNKIDNDTYYKNCPSGYEVWDCAYCGKWTINFYYR